jgi:hypothetical protein
MPDKDQNQQLVEEGKILSTDEMKGGNTATRGSYESVEMTSWDGAGNPIKHVIGQDEEGRLSEGTGPTAGAAAQNTKDSSEILGTDVTPGMESEGGGPGEPLG